MAEIKWIKIATSLKDDAKIRHIRRQKNGDSMALLWVLLLCKAGEVNDGGNVYLADGVPYAPADLADEMGFSEKLVKNALTLFECLHMIELNADGSVTVTNWEKHQSVTGMDKIREDTRARVAKSREKKRYNESECNVTNREPVTLHRVTCNATVTACNATEEDKEEDKEKEKDIPSSPPIVVAEGIENPAHSAHDDARPDFNTLESYASSNLRHLSPGNMEELETFKTELPEDVIRYAIDLATGNGKPVFSYTRAILNRWRDAGVKSLGDAKAENEKGAPRKYTAATGAAKPNPALDYSQREHTEADYNDVFVDLEALYGKNG